MPTYEYKCTECIDRFDIEQPIADNPLTSLEGCSMAANGEHRLKKVFSSIGIAFKGDGFYRNDARRSKSKPRSSDTSSSSDSSSSASSGSDSNSSGSDSSSSGSSSTTTSNGDSATKAKPAEKATPAKAASSD
jgi:putative FmdB family regulatory protein